MHVARDKALLEAGHGNADFGHHAIWRVLKHTAEIAPRQELRVILALDDELVHFRRAVPDENGFVDCFHRMLLYAIVNTAYDR